MTPQHQSGRMVLASHNEIRSDYFTLVPSTLFYFLYPGENGSLPSATSPFIKGCSSLPAVLVVATNAVYPVPTVHSHLPPRVALFNPVSFRIRFVARCAIPLDNLILPAATISWEGINIAWILRAPHQSSTTPGPTTIVMYKFAALATLVSTLPFMASAQSPVWGQCGGMDWSTFTSFMMQTHHSPMGFSPRSRPYGLRRWKCLHAYQRVLLPMHVGPTTSPNALRRNLIYAQILVPERLVLLAPTPHPLPPFLATPTPVLAFTSLLTMPQRSKRLPP